jgi:hypothetical protein
VSRIAHRITEAAIRARVAGVIERDHEINVYLGRAEWRDFESNVLRDFERLRYVSASDPIPEGVVKWNGFVIHEVATPSHFGVGIVGIK